MSKFQRILALFLFFFLSLLIALFLLNGYYLTYALKFKRVFNARSIQVLNGEGQVITPLLLEPVANATLSSQQE
jgi:uncharacterized membrane protein